MSGNGELPQGFDADRLAQRQSYGPCVWDECTGFYRRVQTTHGAQVLECTKCEHQTTASMSGN